MNETLPTALELLAARDPAARELARLAALAARVEPELLRALRLALVPAATVGSEAELWFSEVVFARGAGALTLDQEAVATLRAELAAEIATRRGEALRRILRAVRIVHRTHRGAPALVQLEEDLVRWALFGRTRAIERALARVVSAMVGTPERSEDLAAWAHRALPRLPAGVREARSYWTLVMAANAKSPSMPYLPPVAAALHATAAAAIVTIPASLFEGIDDVFVEVERSGDFVRLRLADTDGPSTIPAPGVFPVLVVVSSAGGPTVARIAERDRWSDEVAVTGPTVRFTVAGGREHLATTIATRAEGDAALDPVARACACVSIGDSKWQTAFLVEPQVLVTQFFEPADARVREVILDGVGRTAHILRPHAMGDIVLLQLDEPVDIPPVALAAYEPSMGTDWRVHGYRGPGHERMVLDGAGPTSQSAGSTFRWVMNHAPTALPPDGASIGSPLVVDGRVVAFVTGMVPAESMLTFGDARAVVDLLDNTRKLESTLADLASARLLEPERANDLDHQAQLAVETRPHRMFGSLQLQQYWRRDTPIWRIAALVAARIFPPHEGAGLLDIVTSALRFSASPFELSTARATAQVLRAFLRPVERAHLDSVIAGLDAMAEVEPVSPWGRLDGLFAPEGRSIFDKSADATVIEAVQAPGTRVVQIVGSTGHQRSGLVRRFAEAFADDVIYARTFEWGASFPEDISPLLNRAAYVVLDRVDCLDEAGRARMVELLVLASQQALSQWVVTASDPIQNVVGESVRIVPLYDMPRDRGLRRFLLNEFEPLSRSPNPRDLEALAAWGVDTVVCVARGAIGSVSDSILEITQAVADWLQCPCPWHARVHGDPNRAGALGALIEYAQEGQRFRFVDLAYRTIISYLHQAQDPVRTVLLMRETVLSGDHVRLIEARQHGLVSAYVQLARLSSSQRRPALPSLRDDAAALRAGVGDPELDLFYSAVPSHLDREQHRVLIETTRAGFAALLRMSRRGQLERLTDLPISWIAEREPPADLEDPNRGRFGGLPDGDGLSVRAAVVRTSERACEVRVDVSIERPERIPAWAHVELYDADGRSQQLLERAPRVSKTLTAFRSFTVGARLGSASVELDLATVPGVPDDFVNPSQVYSAIPLEPGTTWRYDVTSVDASVMAGGSKQVSMTVVDSVVLDHTRPIVVALMAGYYFLSPFFEAWVLVRRGPVYFMLPGGRELFEGLSDGRERVDSVLRAEHVLFRFPIQPGAPVVAGQRDVGWSCESATDDGRTYEFVREAYGPGHLRFTVVEGVGVTASEAAGEDSSWTKLTLAGLVRPGASVVHRLRDAAGPSVIAENSIIAESLGRPDVRIVFVLGGTGLERRRMVGRWVEAHPEEVLFAHTFEAGSSLPEELLRTLLPRDGVVVLDAIDGLDSDGRRRVFVLLTAAAGTSTVRWLVTSGQSVAELAPGATHVVRLDELPRDREVRRILHDGAPWLGPRLRERLGQLSQRGPDVVLRMAVAAVERAIKDAGADADPLLVDALRLATEWLQCPCERHASLVLEGEAPVATDLVALVGATHRQDARAAVDLAMHVLEQVLDGSIERLVPVIQRALLGDDDVRYREALQVGRVSAYLGLGMGWVVIVDARDLDELRALAGDDDLAVFPSLGIDSIDLANRVVIETSQQGLRQLYAAFRQQRLIAFSGLPVDWIAARYPEPDLEDPNRGRFGGLPVRDGVALTARVERSDVQPDHFTVAVEVVGLSGLGQPTVATLFDHNGRARELLWTGSELVGIQLLVHRRSTLAAQIVRHRRAIALELDLAAVRGAPDFVLPSHAMQQFPMHRGMTWRYRGTSTSEGDARVFASTMSIVDVHTLEPSRPVMLAFVNGHPDPAITEPWILVRYGHLYFRLPGSLRRFEALRDASEPLERLLAGYRDLFFRFPVREGDLLSLVPGDGLDWSCEGATRHADGLTSYRFAHPRRGQFTVVDRLGITYYSTPSIAMELINPPKS